ncbi:MAG: universal stress protein [Alphaproteobacteria bacterium]|nr:universal stress protein [Alphaproteobacteria bacterium]
MAIRRILAPLSGAQSDEAALDCAFHVARRCEAHLDGLVTSVDSRDAVAFVGEGMTSAMIDQIMSAAEKEAREREARAGQLFERIRQRHQFPLAERPAASGVSARLLRRTGREDDIVAEQGRLADLIVAAKPPQQEEEHPSLALEAGLRETGRLVLVVPGPLPERIGQRIAIAWNGSVEVGRAVAYARQFLREAEKVVVLSVAEESPYGPPAEDAVEYLAWHGITATSAALPAGERTQGQTLLSAAREQGCDMMVMGAYTRSHMRRLIFGGVTGAVLTETTIPVLMTH